MKQIFATFAAVLFAFSTVIISQAQDTQPSEHGDIMSIADARTMQLGTRVTVTGWVTVTDEFRGPVYFQDETAGIAWFNGPLMREGDFDIDVAHGDSLVITGDLGEFGNIPGEPGTGLLQIVGNDVVFDIYPEGNRDIEPESISINQLNSGNFEGRLIMIEQAVFEHSGVLNGNTEYTITDPGGEGDLYVSQFTDIPGAFAPDGTVDVVGVAGVFRDTPQVLPRSREDIGAESNGFPGDDIPKSETFDVVTWNIEWFGHPENGPNNIEQQYENVITIIETIDADLYAFQEIANNQLFFDLVDDLEDYNGILAAYTQTQRTAYLYRTSTIERLNSGLLTSGQDSFDWAGRLPFWIHFNVTIGDETRNVHAYNLHAKAFPDAESYQRRVNASQQLKAFLDNNRPNDNVIILGDYNDRLTESTRQGEPSPYENFVDDEAYFPVTKSLELDGYTSFRNVDMIDHIIVTNDLINEHLDGAQRVEDVGYISNYLNTTSDHYPVWTRFDLQNLVSVDEDEGEIPHTATLSQNYPNPFNPVTTISFDLPEHQQVRLTVYDVMGRRVATLINNEQRSAGSHHINFDAGSLSSGVYIYRLSMDNGRQLTRKMMLVK